jgi:hypothetical protein
MHKFCVSCATREQLATLTQKRILPTDPRYNAYVAEIWTMAAVVERRALNKIITFSQCDDKAQERLEKSFTISGCCTILEKVPKAQRNWS